MKSQRKFDMVEKIKVFFAFGALSIQTNKTQEVQTGSVRINNDFLD